MSELTATEVLADCLAETSSEDRDCDSWAQACIQRLADSGFVIIDQLEYKRMSDRLEELAQFAPSPHPCGPDWP